MLYNKFGNTGKEVSALGFGAMRLPMIGEDNKQEVNEELAIPLMRHSFELGVNYIDTAPYYCEKLSEIAVGKALKGYRDKVYLSTKNPIENDVEEDWLGRLEKSLKNLDTDYIDFYHFWGINLEGFKRWESLYKKSEGPLKAAEKAKDQGLIKHLSFSYHDKAENLRYIIDSGIFETILIQYNLLDRSHEDNIAYAKEKGLGVVAMGPVGGGRLGVPSEVIQGLLNEGSEKKLVSTPEMAMRFVLANPNVDITLAGMSDLAMLEQNAAIASISGHLTETEIVHVKAMMEENKKLAQLYCTTCNYCKPCPQEINIPLLFNTMNNHRIYGITEHARQTYAEIMAGSNPWLKSADATKCTECGECERKCPQKLAIIQQLKETHETLKPY